VVQLPDQKILVMGGYKEQTTDPTPVNNWGYMGLTDQYDPDVNSWRRLANMNWKREYHAITILVPDGRVIAVGGEGQPGNEPPQSIIEAFSPPYLFRGVRPEILNFNKTTFKRGETIQFEAQKTNALTKVVLMSNAVMTHFMNSGNGRCLDLDFTQNGNQVSVLLPDDSLRLMPGWYMLFGMVDDIPSVAQMVLIEAGKFVSATAAQAAPASTFRVFPNPAAARGSITVEIQSNLTGEVCFVLTDAMGKKIQGVSFSKKTADSKIFTLQTKEALAGVYFLTVRLGKEILGTEKLIIHF
jgi:hypothetical protein